MLCLRFLGLNMKLIANDIYLNYLPGGKVAVSFVVDNPKIANIVVADMKGKNIELQIKEHKSKRSIEQNNLLWAIIENISLKLNGNRADENLWKIYGDILVASNIKRELVAVLPEAVKILERTFRAVIPTGQTVSVKNEKTGKEAELMKVWVYLGSSTFNTKEMTELIDYAIDYAIKVGADV